MATETVKFSNPDTAKKFECLLTKDVSIRVLQAKNKEGKPAPYSGKVSAITPEVAAQMVAEGVNYVVEKAAEKPAK